MSQAGVSALNSAKAAVTAADRQRRRRPGPAKPEPAQQNAAKSVRTNIAPKRRRKASAARLASGLSPNPTWNSSGSRNGVASSPIRQMPPVTVPMWKVLICSRLRSSTGAGLRRACQHVEQQQRHGDREKGDAERPADDRPADILDRQFEQERGRARRSKKPTQIEPRRRRRPEILEQPQRQRAAEHADRNVQKEDPAPRDISRSARRRRSGPPSARSSPGSSSSSSPRRARRAESCAAGSAGRPASSSRRRNPCTTRIAISIGRLVASPHKAEPPAKISTAAQNTRRVPSRSAIQPLTGMNTARLNR